MPDNTKPISSSNPPESKGERRDLDPSQDMLDLHEENQLNGAGLQAHRQERRQQDDEPAQPVTPEEDARRNEIQRQRQEAQRQAQQQPDGRGQPADPNSPIEEKVGDDVTGPPMAEELEATRTPARGAKKATTTRKAPASNATTGDL